MLHTSLKSFLPVHMHRQVVPRLPEDNPVIAALYHSLAAGTVGSPAARALFFTQYHKREKTVTATAGDW